MNMERWSLNSKDSFKSWWHEIVRLSMSKNPWTRSRKKDGIATLQAKKLLWILSLQKIKRFSHDCSQEDTSDFSSDAVEQIASQLQRRWVCKDLLGWTKHDLFGREDSYITYQISQQNWPLFVCSVATLNLTQLPEARLKGRLRYTSARRLSPTEVSISTDAVVPWAVEIWLLQNS